MTGTAELSVVEMEQVEGGDFWSGLGCGLGALTSFYTLVSPEPFSKLALLGYGGTLISCTTAFNTSGGSSGSSWTGGGGGR